MTSRTTGTFAATNSTHETEDNKRHWAAGSQTYAPADVLMHYMQSGWSLDNMAAVETFYYAGYRKVDIYYFTLRNADEVVEMPVIANPVVRRVVEEHKLTVLRINAALED